MLSKSKPEYEIQLVFMSMSMCDWTRSLPVLV